MNLNIDSNVLWRHHSLVCLGFSMDFHVHFFAVLGNCIVLILMNSFLSSVLHCLFLLHQCLSVMFPYPTPLKFCFIWPTGYGFYYQNFTEFLISLFSPKPWFSFVPISIFSFFNVHFIVCILNLFHYYIFMFGCFLFEVANYFYTLTFELFAQHVNNFIVFRFSNWGVIITWNM